MKATKHRVVPAWRRKLLTLAVASCFAGEFAYANPTGPAVAHGAASIATQGNVLTVTNTPGTVINWQGFSIANQEITRFLQQSAASTVLNRVVGVNPSTILGTLQSNGRVFLINPSGITIGPGATIDVAGFVASTLNLSDPDFLAGRYRFSSSAGTGSVVNQGTINTPAGGMVYLVGQNVENHGIIKSPKGEILLAAGKSIELVDAGTPEIRVQITASDNQAVNLGQLIASGGRIGMYGGLVRQSGVVNANTAVVGENGKIAFKAVKDVKLEAGSTTTASGPTAGSIKVEAETGKATIAGTVEANASAGRGGSIEVSGQQAVTVEATGRLSANGNTEGGAVRLSSGAGPVQVAGQVSANASAGRGGQVAITATTQATIANGANVTASGPLGGGSVSAKAGESITFESGSAIQANGASGGAVIVSADQGSVEINGSIEATGADAQGGTIRVTALTDITLGDGSVLSTLGQRGGEVRIEARKGTLLASGSIDGSGNDGTGGKILLLAPHVGLVRNASLNVSGKTGGGETLVGGDYQGGNPDIQNAERTYVGPDVLITADAIETGNGGKVIIWADDWTKFYGSVSAKGGAQQGDGGFVEVSGKQTLHFNGRVDTTAPRGATGSLLLDPADLQITNGAAIAGDLSGAAADGTILSADPDGTTNGVAEQTLEGLLATTNVTLEASGQITVNNLADNLLNMKQTGGAANFKMTSTSAGGITFIDAADEIRTQGGNITLQAQGTGSLSNIGKLTSNGGAITLESATTIGLSGAINSGAGAIAITTTSGTITQNAATITGGAGGISIAAGGTTSDIALGANVSATGGIVTMNAGRDITQSTGAISGNTISLTAGTGGGGNGAIGVTGTPIKTTATTLNLAAAGTGEIVLTESNGATLASATTGSGQIKVVSTAGDLSVGTVTTTGNVTLTATSGDILDATSAVTGATVNLTADGNIGVAATPINTTATTLNLTGTGNGQIAVTESDGVTLASATTGSGAIKVVSTTGDLIVGTVTTSKAIVLTALNGSVLDDGTAANTTSSGGATIITATGVGKNIGTAANPLDIDGPGNTVTLTAAGGAVHVNTVSAGDVEFKSSTLGADITTTFKQGGETYSATYAADAGGHFTVRANGNILNSDGITVLVPAATLTLASSAANGRIGTSASAEPILTKAGILKLTGAGTGEIVVTESDGATLDLAITGSGNIKAVSTTGDLSVGTVTTTGIVTLQATTGKITDNNGATNNVTAASLTASAATGIDLDTTIGTLTSANVTGTGNIDISDAAGGLVVTSATTANGNITLNATSGDLAVTTVTAVGAGADVTLTTTTSGNITLGVVTAPNAVTLNAAGAITDTNAGAANVIATSLSATAATGIDLDTTISTLTSASVSGAGNIDISNSGALTVTSATTGNGDVKVVSTTGDLTVGTVTATGTVILTATAGDILDATSAITGATVNLTAGGADGDIGVAATPINTTATTLNLVGAGTGEIAVTESNGATLTTATTGSGQIKVVSTTGDLTVGTVTTTGNVTLEATAGAIVDGNGVTNNISGSIATLTAATGIGSVADPLETTVTSLSVTTTSAVAPIHVVETNALSSLTVKVNASDVNIAWDNSGVTPGSNTLTFAGSTLNASAATAPGTNLSFENTGGGISAGLVDAGAANVSLKSSGAITSAAVDTVADIVGATVTLETTSGDIGVSAGARLEVNATTLNAKTAGAAGDDIFILDTAGGVAAGLITAGAGNVDLKSAGSITSAAVDTVADIVGATVTLETTSGDIGVSAGARLEINATTLNAKTAGAVGDDIFILDTAGGVAAGLITAGAGNVDLKSAGAISSSVADGTVADIVGATVTLETTSGGIGVNAGARLEVDATTLNAKTAGADIFILDTAGGVAAGLITAGAGNVDLKSGGAITSAAVDTVADIVGATVTLETTGAGATIGTSAANRLELNATTLNAKTAGLVSEDIFILDTAGGVAVGLISATLGNVDLKAVGGAITDGNGAGTNNVTAATLTASAVTGITLDTTIGTLTSANVTGTGAIDIANAGALTVTSASTNSGTIKISAGGDISVGSITAAGNSVTLATTAGTINELAPDDGGPVTDDITAGSVSLTAIAGIGTASRLDLNVPTVTLATTGTGGITLRDAAATSTYTNVNTTGAGNIDLLNTGAATLTSVTANSGTIIANAGGNIVVGSITDTAGVNSVTLATTAGAITDGNGAGTNNVTAASLTASAVTGIALDTTIGTLTSATVTGTGAIDIANAGALTVTSASTNSGTIKISAGGNIAVGSITDTAGVNSVTLATTAGTINEVTADDGAPVTDITAGSVSLTATTGIGTASRLDLDVPTVTLATTGTGGITLRDAASISTYTNVNTTGAGNIDLLSLGGAKLTSVTANNGTITANAGSHITVGSVTATGSSVTLATTNGEINEVTADDGAPVTDIVAGSVSLTATTGIGTLSRLDLNVPTVTLATTGTGGITLRDAAATSTYTNVNTTGVDNIDLLSTGAATLTSVTANSGTITANAGGNITVGSVTTTGVNVTLATTVGAITDGNGAGANNVTAQTLSASAVTGITLDTNITTLTSASVTGTGAIDIANTGALTVTSASTNSGAIKISAGGDIAVGSITAAGNSVTLATTAGRINADDGSAVTDITAGSVSLTATTGIGDALPLYLDVPTVTLATTGTGGIALRDAAATSTYVNVNTTGAGNIDLKSTGAATLTSVTANSGTIIANADGNIAVGSVTATGNSVTLATTVGAITDGNGAGTNNVTAASLTALAGTGITLDTTITTLTLAHVTGTGAIDIANAGALTVTDASTNSGTIKISAGGDISVGSITAAGNSVTLATTAGKINEVTPDDGAPVTDITAASVSLTATTGIGTLSRLDMNVPTVTLATTGTGGITLRDAAATSTYTNVNTTGAGNIDLLNTGAATLTSVTANSGTITANASGNIAVGSVTATGNSVTLATTAGAITDGNGAGTNNVTAASLTASAVTGITLDTTIGTLTSASVTGTGNIDISNSGALTVASATTGNGDVKVVSTTGDLSVGTVTATGTVILTATAGDILDATSAITGATVNLTAGGADGDIGVAATPIKTTATTLNLVGTGTGEIAVTESNGATLATATTGSGQIKVVSSGGDLSVGTVSTTGTVILTATAGDILDATSAITGATVNLTAGGADGDIGVAATPINTTATTLSLVGTGTGEIAVTESNGVTLSSATTGSGQIKVVSSGGDLSVGTVSTSGTVILTATVGAITRVAGVISANELVLDAGTNIGAAGRMQTDVAILEARAANGGIFVTEASALQIGGAVAGTLTGVSTTGGNGMIDIRTTAGGITITENTAANGSGGVDLRSGGGTSDIGINGATVSSGTGTLQLIAGQAITTSTPTSTTTELQTGGAVRLQAGTTIGSNGNRIEVQTGTLAAAATGDIFIHEIDGVTVGSVNALNGAVPDPLVGITSTGAGVTLTSGTTLDVNTAVSAATGASLSSGTGALTILATGPIVGGNGNVFLGGNTINTAGNVTTTNKDVTFNSPTSLTGDVVVSAGTGKVTFANTVNGPSGLTVTASGDTTFVNTVGASTSVGHLTLDGGGSTMVNGGIVTTSGNQTYSDPVTTGAPTAFSATASTATIAFNSTLTAGANALTVSADEINFAGGAGSVTGSGALILQANTVGAGINIGSTAGATVGILDISATDIAALANGFGSITIGAAAGSHAINIGNATFTDPLIIRAPVTGGTLTVSGALVGTDNASIVLGDAGSSITIGPGTVTAAPGQTLTLSTVGPIGGSGTVTGGIVSIVQAGGIGSIGSPVQLNTTFLSAANSVSGDVVINNAGSVTLTGQFQNTAPGGQLRLTTASGSIDTGGVAVQSAGGPIALVANDGVGGATGNITVGPGGISSAGGQISLHAADNVAVNGSIAAGTGGLRILAGTGPGINAGHATFTGANPPVATEPALDENGLIALNAPISAADIVLISSTSTTPTVINAITQTAGGTITSTGGFTAVSLRGGGAPGSGGGTIDLNDATPGNNSTGAINLFACSFDGCPAPLATAPYINVGAPVPPFTSALFSDGELFYSDIGGTSVNGIGTAGDFRLFTPGSVTIAGPSLSAKNLYIEAQQNININLNAPFTNNDINGGRPGGSLNFIAGQNVNYTSVMAGSTVGTAAVPFNHDLVFTAAGNVTVGNSLYVGTGNFIVQANQPVSLNNSTLNIPASGTGSVIMQGNHEVRSQGGILVRGVNFTMLGGDIGSPNQSVAGQGLFATGPVILEIPGTVSVIAGTATSGSNSAAVIEGARIDIGSAASRSGALNLTGGTSTVTGTTDRNAEARISATEINVFVSGDVNLTGGTSNITGTAGTTQSARATAALVGDVINFDAMGNVNVRGGNATAAAGGNTASSSASIVSNTTFNPIISGDLTVMGGTSTAQPVSGQTAMAEANAEIRTAGNLQLSIGRDINVIGGTASANTQAGGTSATATSSAALAANGIKDLQVGRHLSVTGGSATTSGAGAMATAIAGTDAGNAASSALTLKITTGGNMVLQGGMEAGAASLASAAILSAGEIKMFINGPLGLTLVGGGGSDMFQLIATTLISVEGKSYPITVQGAFGANNGLAQGDAFIISGAPPLNLDALLAAFLRTTDCVTFSGGSCTVPGNSTTRAGDTSKSQGGAGVCK